MGRGEFSAVVVVVAVCLATTVPATAGGAGATAERAGATAGEFGAAGGTTAIASSSAAIASNPTTATTNLAQANGVTPDTIVMRVQVHENGSATWEVEYRTRLDDQETTEAFRSLQSDIENDSAEHSEQFVRRMRGTISGAEQATGREMNGTNFTVDADLREFPQRYGVVVYSFRWTGFAAVGGSEMHLGDALSGLVLDEKTRLLISWPEEYEATTVRPTPDERRERGALWVGPTEFTMNEPRIVLSVPGSGPFDLPNWLDLPTWLLAALAGGVAVVGLGGAWWLFRRRDGAAPEEDEGDTTDDRPPEDLLSNEERVLRVLERHNGRVKQKAIVSELGWTEAKTSQVVGRLREEGKIESFRLGRENVLALPRQEP
ncbi:helix-turn-helix transcriptional regulator [Halorussus halophilus]|uniref:helix-turn-helix transcriptional regulator n=1 Tax=Halorussus halophilus TaxID=2650975 RepID=UPI001301797D|nr:hypothetical protein [Halorussus halophilus]